MFRSERIMNQLQKHDNRYQLPIPTIILFSKFLDHYFLTKFNEECKEFFEILFNGREMIQYGYEVECFSSFLFYFSSILSYNATPGQLFGELKQFHAISEKDGKVAVPSMKQKLLTSLWYVLLPYLYHKKSQIWKVLYDTWKILFQKENVSNTDPSRDPVNPQESEQEDDIEDTKEKPSFLWIVFLSIQKSISSISNEVDKCLERLFLYVHDIHILGFLFTGK